MHAPRWLLIGILIVIASNALDVIGTANSASQFSLADVPFSPTVKIALSMFWIVTFSLLTRELWRRRRWAFRWAAILLTAYGAINLLWFALFVRADYGRGRLPFLALATVILLAPVWWVTIRRGWLRSGNGK
jgi:hypothetical protein